MIQNLRKNIILNFGLIDEIYNFKNFLRKLKIFFFVNIFGLNSII